MEEFVILIENIDMVNGKKIEANPYGVMLSKYYPRIPLDCVVVGENITINCDIGSFKKGDVIKDNEGVKQLIVELLNIIQTFATELQTMKTAIQNISFKNDEETVITDVSDAVSGIISALKESKDK